MGNPRSAGLVVSKRPARVVKGAPWITMGPASATEPASTLRPPSALPLCVGPSLASLVDAPPLKPPDPASDVPPEPPEPPEPARAASFMAPALPPVWATPPIAPSFPPSLERHELHADRDPSAIAP